MTETTPQTENLYEFFTNIVWLGKSEEPNVEFLNYLKDALSLLKTIIEEVEYSGSLSNRKSKERLFNLGCTCFMSRILRGYSEALETLKFEAENIIEYSQGEYDKIEITEKEIKEYYEKIINMTVEDFLNEIDQTLKYIDEVGINNKEIITREFFFYLILLKYNHLIFFDEIPYVIFSKISSSTIYSFEEYYKKVKNIEKYVDRLIKFQFKYYYPYLFKIEGFRKWMPFYILYYLLLKAIKELEKKNEEYRRSVSIYHDYARIYHLIFCNYFKPQTSPLIKEYINKVLEATVENLREKLNNQNDALVLDFSNINVDEKDLLRMMMSIASKNEEFKEFAKTIVDNILYDEKLKEECEEILNGKKKFKGEIVIEIPLVPLNNKEKEIVKL